MKDHLEPEILAAWLDGSLTDRERGTAEAHAADCDRCRGVLAAMVRTEPPAPSPFAWLSGFSVRWLVPVTAVGVALLVWNIAARPTRVAMPPKEVRSESSPAPSAPSTAPPATPQAAAPTAPAQYVPDAAPPQRARQAVPTPAGAGTARRGEQVPAEAAAIPDTRAVSESVVVQSPPPPPATAAAPTPPAPVVAQAPPPPATPVAAPVTAPPEPSAASAKAAEPRSRVAGGVAGGVVGGVVGGVAADRVQTLAETVEVQSRTAPGQFSSADGSVTWRIGPAGRILQSADGGKTWSAQTSGVTVDLLAGSAPAPDVSWVVGRSGVVLLQAGQAEWKRIPFPEPVDLVGVSARDATTASVTTRDGRLFTTSDGGTSWRPGR